MEKEQMIEHVRELIADMPQPDPFRRVLRRGGGGDRDSGK